MNEAKRKRLEKKGWRFTGVKEFLGLSAEEAAFIEIKLKLAHGLRLIRTKRGLKQIQAAKAVQSSQSRFAKMEAGDATVSLDLLVKSHLTLGTSEVELGRIIARPLLDSLPSMRKSIRVGLKTPVRKLAKKLVW